MKAIATLCFVSLVAFVLATSAYAIKNMNIVTVQQGGPDMATFHSFNQKVVEDTENYPGRPKNSSVYISFMSSKRSTNVADYWFNYKLLLSTDRSSFELVGEDRCNPRPPLLESDRATGDFYLMVPGGPAPGDKSTIYWFKPNSPYYHRKLDIPKGSAGKYAGYLGKNEFFYITFWSGMPNFFSIPRDLKSPGTSLKLQKQVPNDASAGGIQYPSLTMSKSDDNTLFAAWTTTMKYTLESPLLKDTEKTLEDLNASGGYYRSIQFLYATRKNHDEEWVWRNPENGEPLTLPLDATNDSNGTVKVVRGQGLTSEVNTWLANMLAYKGCVHFYYRARFQDDGYNINSTSNYVRFKIDGTDPESTPVLKPDKDWSKEFQIDGISGFFVRDTRLGKNALYFVGFTNNKFIRVLISSDNGENWKVHAEEPLNTEIYSLTGYREVTTSGHIVGMFVEITAQANNLKFFSVPE